MTADAFLVVPHLLLNDCDTITAGKGLGLNSHGWGTEVSSRLFHEVLRDAWSASLLVHRKYQFPKTI